MWLVYAEKRARIEDQLDRAEFVYAVCDNEAIADELKKECESITDTYTRNGEYLHTYKNVYTEKVRSNERLLYD